MSLIPEFIPGDTLTMTWVWSGEDSSAIAYKVLNSSDTPVECGTLTDSGNGFAYAHHTTSYGTGYFIDEMYATVNGNPYVRRNAFRVGAWEVD